MSKTKALALLILALGCTKEKYGDPLSVGEEELAAAQSLVDVVSSLEVLATADPGDSEALGNVTAVYDDLTVLLEAKIAQQGFFMVMAQATGGDLLDPSCYVQSEGTVTYTDCETGGGTLSGTVTWSGNSGSASLTIVNTEGEYPYEVEVTGNATIDETSISGEITFLAGVTQEGAVTIFDVTLEYDIVLVDQCAVDGQFEITASYYPEEEPDVGPAESEEFAIKVEFGPSCGDITVY